VGYTQAFRMTLQPSRRMPDPGRLVHVKKLNWAAGKEGTLPAGDSPLLEAASNFDRTTCERGNRQPVPGSCRRAGKKEPLPCSSHRTTPERGRSRTRRTENSRPARPTPHRDGLYRHKSLPASPQTQKSHLKMTRGGIPQTAPRRTITGKKTPVPQTSRRPRREKRDPRNPKNLEKKKRNEKEEISPGRGNGAVGRRETVSRSQGKFWREEK